MKARVLCLVAALGAVLVGLTACQEDMARITVQYATMKVIEKGDTPAAQQQRAARIHQIASDAEGLLKGVTVTVNLLEAAVREQVGKLNLSPSDGFLVDALISQVVSDLQQKVGTAALNEDQRFKVAKVLDWVISGAAQAGG